MPPPKILKFTQIPQDPQCQSVALLASLIDVQLETTILTNPELDDKPRFIKYCCSGEGYWLYDGETAVNNFHRMLVYLMDYHGRRLAWKNLYPVEVITRFLIDELLAKNQALYIASFQIFINKFKGEPDQPHHLKSIYDRIQLIEDCLIDHPNRKFLVINSMTIGDIFTAVTIRFAAMSGINIDRYPRVIQYIEDVRTSIPRFSEIVDDPFKSDAFSNDYTGDIEQLVTTRIYNDNEPTNNCITNE